MWLRPADDARRPWHAGCLPGRWISSSTAVMATGSTQKAGGQVAHEATRRGLLAAAAALPLVAAGCKGIGGLGTPPPPAPDVAVLGEAIAGERAMISRYSVVLATVPDLAGSLGPLLDQHRAHLARLQARLLHPRTTGGASASPSASVPAGLAAALRTSAAARAYLRAAEDSAAQALLSHLAVASPSLAQLLASVAASEATHALILTTPGPAR
jgi:hypothetical protein